MHHIHAQIPFSILQGLETSLLVYRPAATDQLHIFRVKRDDAICEGMLAFAQTLWKEYVRPGQRPRAVPRGLWTEEAAYLGLLRRCRAEAGRTRALLIGNAEGRVHGPLWPRFRRPEYRTLWFIPVESERKKKARRRKKRALA